MVWGLVIGKRKKPSSKRGLGKWEGDRVTILKGVRGI